MSPLRICLLTLLLILATLQTATAKPQKRVVKKKLTLKRRAYINPPNSGACPQFTGAKPPIRGATPQKVLNTTGWVAGRLVNYRDPRSGPTLIKMWKGIWAGTCFDWTLCAMNNPSMAPVGYVSWQARTNSGTKGDCYLFAQSTCSPRYNPGLNPFLVAQIWWYTASVTNPLVEPVCAL